MKQNFIEDNLIILSKQTLDIFLKENNPRDLISLYCFYYYTAKWQKTNQPKASISFCAKGLKCGKDKIRKNRQILIKLNLIEDVRYIDEKTRKVKGWYVKIKYVWKQENHPINSPEGGLIQRVDNRDINALSANNENALSANTISLSKDKDGKPKISREDKIKIIETTKQTFNLKKLDDTGKWNFIYAGHLIKKCGNIDNALKVIELASKDIFWRSKITKVKTLWANCVAIVNNCKQKADKVAVHIIND